ncbi:hypothetical protein K438DRAFT_1816009 [Mycena galopus ATCC 62051]|nr:hypothetical protein K438DRAFT_1816009 [Mycena galopus ATCC 62051]
MRLPTGQISQRASPGRPGHLGRVPHRQGRPRTSHLSSLTPAPSLAQLGQGPHHEAVGHARV